MFHIGWWKQGFPVGWGIGNGFLEYREDHTIIKTGYYVNSKLLNEDEYEVPSACSEAGPKFTLEDLGLKEVSADLLG